MTDLQRVQEVLYDALQCDPSARDVFLDDACQGDHDLRHEIDSLLSQEEARVPILQQPLFNIHEPPKLPECFTPDQKVDPFTIDKRIGPYLVKRILGEGGMAVVALAIRADHFEKQVALKVARPGVMSEEVKRRFHDERQLLARLEHPNITRLYDGGTTDDGLPYYVMEYVDGKSITRHCEIAKSSLREELELVLQICSALGYAHQRLVVHRDLKPQNIYVGTDGHVKVLDFGIAKVLSTDQSPGATSPCLNPMTPKYASPEQIRGEPASTGTDIYSTGVILYELLAHRHPFEHAADPGHLAAAIREEQPPSLRTALARQHRRPAFSKDLDCIVLKAMNKEPGERYPSAQALADDIRRFLKGKPVSARTQSWHYTASKYLYRNRTLGAAAILLITVALALFLAVTSAREKSQEERTLQARAKERAYRTAMRGQSLELLHDVLDAVASRRPGQAEMALAQALGHGEKDLELDATYLLPQADILSAAILTLNRSGLYSGEIEVAEAIELRLRDRYDKDWEPLSRSLNNVGVLYFKLKDYDKAEALYIESLNLKKYVCSETYDVNLDPAMSNLAMLHSRRGELQEELGYYSKVVDLRAERLGEEHPMVANSSQKLGLLRKLVVTDLHPQAQLACTLSPP